MGIRPKAPIISESRDHTSANYIMQIENSYHKSSCVETYYQCSLQSTESNVLAELFAQIISVSANNTLRTQEQLGYIVWSGVRRASGVQGIRFIVQSERHPAYVDSRIEAFLVSAGEDLRRMDQEEFDRHKEALAAQRLEKPKKLIVQTGRYWSEIAMQQYNFDRANIEVDYLRNKVTKDDVIKFYDELLSANSSKRHKLAIHVLSKAEGGAGTIEDGEKTASNGDGQTDPNAEIIEDLIEFKSSQCLFPLVQPFLQVGLRFRSTKAKL
ncbi:insulin-degrading enzyme-like [Nilaparvata lugens]|uniref:insulin-degrading enzyme-like n=1 Tax=Nilaparvata lugens TaxID=108931 RepID=UPI00193E695A|nr:insulin-degrading enzyme-like [Nilaparvata lugens]